MLAIKPHNLKRLVSSQFSGELTVIAILMLATVIINLRMIRDGLNGQADLIWHVTWLQHFAQQLSEGILYPRWLAGTNYGYGSPTFVFYPPLPHYLGSLLKLVGFNIEQTMIGLFSISIFLSGLNFYIYGRSHWSVVTATFGALAYMTVPFVALTTYWASSISSLFAIAWLPLGWWLTEKTFQQAKWGFGLMVFWTILALTHLPSLLICFVAWIPYVLIQARSYPWRTLFNQFHATCLGLGISAFYLLPAYFEKSWVNIQDMTGAGGAFQDKMIGAPREATHLVNLNYLTIFNHQSLMMVVLVIVTGIALFFSRENIDVKKTHIRQVSYWLISALVIAFFMSYLSWPLWQLSSTLQQIQSPYRLFMFFAFQEATLFALALDPVLQLPRFPKIVLSVILVGLLLVNFGFGYQFAKKFPTIHKPGRANIEYLNIFKTALYDPFTNKLADISGYRPLLANQKAVPQPQMNQPPVAILDGQATIEMQAWQSYQRNFRVSATTETSVRIRTYTYPAWQLYVNDRLHPTTILDDGTIGFRLPPGDYVVRLSFGWTPMFFWGTVLSLICCIYIGLAAFRLFRPKLNHTTSSP